MKVTLHEYVTDPSLPQKDGVNLAHENITRLMKQQAAGVLEVEFHDFNRLLKDDLYARQILENTDCVISNVGPHAHYYFYLRARFGLDFRIVRDVRTALWSSYLLQEHLCAPYLTANDVLMAATHYTRGVYEKIFPHLRGQTFFRCYPMAVDFPARLPDRVRDASGAFTLGYVGRLSDDKNFPDIVELLIHLNLTGPGRFRLIACGDIHSPGCDPDTIAARLRTVLGDGDFFTYLPPRSNGDIWSLYRRFDALVFPSTSNLETLGRVLIEASYAGVPIVSGAHAAAPELLPEQALCEVDYMSGKTFDTHFDHRLGSINPERLAAVVQGGELQAPDCHLDFLRHPENFVRMLSMTAQQLSDQEVFTLYPAQRTLVNRITADLPPVPDKHGADGIIGRLIPQFLALQDKASGDWQENIRRLFATSRYPERTRRYIDKATATRGDFTNVGGIDMELCHGIGFYPAFRLEEELEDLSPYSAALHTGYGTSGHQ